MGWQTSSLSLNPDPNVRAIHMPLTLPEQAHWGPSPLHSGQLMGGQATGWGSRGRSPPHDQWGSRGRSPPYMQSRGMQETSRDFRTRSPPVAEESDKIEQGFPASTWSCRDSGHRRKPTLVQAVSHQSAYMISMYIASFPESPVCDQHVSGNGSGVGLMLRHVAACRI